MGNAAAKSLGKPDDVVNAELAQRRPAPSGRIGGIAGLVPCFVSFLAKRPQGVDQHRSLGVAQPVNEGMDFMQPPLSDIGTASRG